MQRTHKFAARIRRAARLVALPIAAGFLPLVTNNTPAAAQEGRPNRIIIEYVKPTNSAHQPIYDLLKERKVLEKLQEIFSPFKLPIDITLKAVGCDGVVNAWYRRPTLTICYEYLDDIRNTTPKETTPTGLTPQDAVIGQLFYVVAHEMGHAMFDLLGVPIFAAEEQAADAFAAYMMLQLGKDQARRLIGGAAYSYKDYVEKTKVTVPQTAFAEVHGAPMQRFYNLLCIGYGAQPDTFADLVEKEYLPKNRAGNCRREFGELNFAFRAAIVPHLDPALVKEVLDKAWLPDPARPASPDTSQSEAPAK